jgi:hypothetical protein
MLPFAAKSSRFVKEFRDLETSFGSRSCAKSRVPVTKDRFAIYLFLKGLLTLFGRIGISLINLEVQLLLTDR